MDDNNLIKPTDRWLSIVPANQVNFRSDTWSLDIPNLGNLQISLLDKPGRSGEANDQKAFVLGTDLDGLEVGSLTLMSKGYKTLSVLFNPINPTETLFVSVRSGGSKTIFNGVMQINSEENNLLSPKSLWTKEHEKEGEKSHARDIMVMPGEELTKIQIHFEGGGY